MTSTPLPTKFRIGRLNRDTHRLDFAFYLESTSKGGIRITGIATKLTDMERHTLLAHFGQKQTGPTGGLEDDRLVTRETTEKPGTAVHFVRACHTLPDPFSIMAENYESYLRPRSKS